jgi:hypothetical protein
MWAEPVQASAGRLDSIEQSFHTQSMAMGRVGESAGADGGISLERVGPRVLMKPVRPLRIDSDSTALPAARELQPRRRSSAAVQLWHPLLLLARAGQDCEEVPG